MIRAQFICKKCKKIEEDVKCWADVLAEKEYIIDFDTIHFPYEHICVLSGIEIMRKEFGIVAQIRLFTYNRNIFSENYSKTLRKISHQFFSLIFHKIFFLSFYINSLFLIFYTKVNWILLRNKGRSLFINFLRPRS